VAFEGCQIRDLAFAKVGIGDLSDSLELSGNISLNTAR
jgi:hypothetical protein